MSNAEFQKIDLPYEGWTQEDMESISMDDLRDEMEKTDKSFQRLINEITDLTSFLKEMTSNFL
jgi:hypothetical protein